MDIIQEDMSLNEVETYTDEELINLQTIIENMEKTNQVKVLRILKKHNDVTINENKNGIHINLSEIKKPIIDDLMTFINYVNKQELMLSPDEKIKEEYKMTYF
jgi:repressor of nif and glnA expression